MCLRCLTSYFRNRKKTFFTFLIKILLACSGRDGVHLINFTCSVSEKALKTAKAVKTAKARKASRSGFVSAPNQVNQLGLG